MYNNGLTTLDVLGAFADAAAIHQGVITDTYRDETRLFARAVLPREDDVRAKDRFQAGVAIKAGENDICLHPYMFRLVCSNGAIMAQAVQSRKIDNFFELPADEAMCQLRQGVDACCATEAFSQGMSQVRSTLDRQADLMLAMIPFISRMSERNAEPIIRELVKRFMAEDDRSQFGVMNAVTSLARDTTDPQVRWNLEELGGAVTIMASDLKPRPRQPVPARQARRVPVSIG